MNILFSLKDIRITSSIELTHRFCVVLISREGKVCRTWPLGYLRKSFQDMMRRWNTSISFRSIVKINLAKICRQGYRFHKIIRKRYHAGIFISIL